MIDGEVFVEGGGGTLGLVAAILMVRGQVPLA